MTYFRRARTLRTGQTTQYSSELDDGYYQKGIAKPTAVYNILTTGTFADTVNIDLTHLVSTHIAFVKGTPNDSITSDTTNFTTLFVAGDVLVFSGSSGAGGVNNTNRTIAAGGVAAGTITLTSDNQQVSVIEGDEITIKKREAHSNACVLDNNTGLMWSQTVSGKMGVLSTGLMPWTGRYKAAAGAVTFSDAADTIVDTGNGLAMFKTNDIITTDSAGNLGPFTVTTGNVAGTITCVGATFTAGTPAGSVTITNQTNQYSIYSYCAVANIALMGGYGDWRIPNRRELESLIDTETLYGLPNSTAFPTWVTIISTSSTNKETTTKVEIISYGSGDAGGGIITGVKTTNRYCVLVRGG